MVPTMRPSPNTSILAPTRCGVDPVVATMVTSAAGSPRSSAAATAAKTSRFMQRRLYGAAGGEEGQGGQEGEEGQDGQEGQDGLWSRAPSVPLLLPILPVPPIPPVYRCRSQSSCGSVPAMNDSEMIFGQFGVASLPVCASMSAKTMPSGTVNGTLARPASAVFMKCVQIGSAARAPLRPTGWLSSKPTHTTVSSSGVKPANQASRRSLVVPVFPAASSVKPAERALAAVPSLSTLRIMLVTRNVVSGFATSRATTVLRLVTSLPPLTIRVMCCSDRSMPPLGNSV